MISPKKFGTYKHTTLPKGGLQIIALSEAFDKAHTVLVSKDGETWIAHEAKGFMDKVNSEKPIKVA